MERALEAYLRESYSPNGSGAVYGSVGADGTVRVTVCISSAHFNPKNFWNGALRSRWVATLPAAAGSNANATSAALSGALSACVHYFEEGNVQLATSHAATSSVTTPAGASEEASVTALGGAIVAALRAAEGDYYAGLEGSFDALAQRTFKELRRALPVTRSKFPWEQAQHKLAVELATKEKAAAAAAAR